MLNPKTYLTSLLNFCEGFWPIKALSFLFYKMFYCKVGWIKNVLVQKLEKLMEKLKLVGSKLFLGREVQINRNFDVKKLLCKSYAAAFGTL